MLRSFEACGLGSFPLASKFPWFVSPGAATSYPRDIPWMHQRMSGAIRKLSFWSKGENWENYTLCLLISVILGTAQKLTILGRKRMGKLYGPSELDSELSEPLQLVGSDQTLLQLWVQIFVSTMMLRQWDSLLARKGGTTDHHTYHCLSSLPLEILSGYMVDFSPPHNSSYGSLLTRHWLGISRVP
jgi:hypothetical protein